MPAASNSSGLHICLPWFKPERRHKTLRKVASGGRPDQVNATWFQQSCWTLFTRGLAISKQEHLSTRGGRNRWRRRLLEVIVNEVFDFVSTEWFIYQVDGSFMARLGAAGGLAGKLKKTATTSVWREGIKKITIALVPTTLKGNKWLFNISMHSKRRRGGGGSRGRWWIKQKEATRKSRSGGIFVRQRGNMRHVKSCRLFI